MNSEYIRWIPRLEIFRYHDSDDRISTLGHEGVTLKEINEDFLNRFISYQRIDKNIALNVGINIMWNLLAGAGGTVFNNANTNLLIGDSTAAVAATQLGLQASTNKTAQGMDSSYPASGSSQQIIFRSTFGTTAAAYAWNELVCANGNNPPTTGIALNRVVQPMGTKPNTTSWIALLTIQLQ